MVLSSSPTSDSTSFPVPNNTISQVADNDLQPFFVLHRAATRKSDETCSSGADKTRRKLNLSLCSPKSTGQDQHDFEKLRLQAFDLTWSKMDSTIKDVLKDVNLNLFEEIFRWIRDSFSTLGCSSPPEIIKPFPITADVTCKRMPTALVFTKNAEFVDDVLTFQDLKRHLLSNGCHVANLSALDFSIKQGVGSCLRSLSRQLMLQTSDAADVHTIASWYCKPANYDTPIVVIIEEMERCDSAVLADFIKLFSEWVMKIPIILIVGVATTSDAPNKILPSSVLHNLQLYQFTLGSPQQKIDSLIEGVLVRSCSGFFIGHEIAVFLKNYFHRYDGTITSFLKALKLACVKHFSREPLSFLCLSMLEEDSEDFLSSKYEISTEVLQRYTSDFPSCQRGGTLGSFGDNFKEVFSELNSLQSSWSSVVMCLFEVGKLSKIHLLDIFCEAVDPSLCSLRDFDEQLQLPFIASTKSDAKPCSTKGGFISQVIQKVRELPHESLRRLLNKWGLHMAGVNEISEKVIELQSMIKISSPTLKERRTENIHRPLVSSVIGMGAPSLNDEAVLLLFCMFRKFLVPIETAPFHEILCFSDVAALKSALVGDPRRKIQDDLFKCDGYLQRNSLGKSDKVASSSTHDTAIMYNLAQEYGDLINLHDWFQSFRMTVMSVMNYSTKAKCKVLRSPASKKGKATPPENEAIIQARFCRAVTELQITGLVRMPSKRRPDFLQRIAFDI